MDYVHCSTSHGSLGLIWFTDQRCVVVFKSYWLNSQEDRTCSRNVLIFAPEEQLDNCQQRSIIWFEASIPWNIQLYQPFWCENPGIRVNLGWWWWFALGILAGKWGARKLLLIRLAWFNYCWLLVYLSMSFFPGLKESFETANCLFGSLKRSMLLDVWPILTLPEGFLQTERNIFAYLCMTDWFGPQCLFRSMKSLEEEAPRFGVPGPTHLGFNFHMSTISFPDVFHVLEFPTVLHRSG